MLLKGKPNNQQPMVIQLRGATLQLRSALV